MERMRAELGDILSLRMRAPFVTAHGTYTHREVAVLRLEVSSSVWGVGEVAPLPGFSTESMADAHEELRGLIPALERVQAPTSLEDVKRVLETLCLEAPSARYALETALLDLCARRLGVSVARLLGATQDAVAVNATIGAEKAPVCFSRAMELVEQGFRCFKLKVGGRALEEDVARVRAVRDAIGDAATLRLDANGAWGVEEAVKALTSLRGFGLSLVEQPVSSLEDMVLVRRQCDVRLGADESIRCVDDARRVLKMGAADVLVLKPALLGGVLIAREIEALAQEAGVRVLYTTLLDGAVGRAGALHAAVASDALEGPCGLATASLLEEDVTDTPEGVSGGVMYLSQASGLGVDVRPVSHETHEFAWEACVPLPLVQRAVWEPERPALVDDACTWTYAELYDDARVLADRLVALGVSRGTRVGVQAKNSARLVALIHALGLRGAVFVALHPRWTPQEASEAAERARCQLVVCASSSAWPCASVTLDDLARIDAPVVTHETRVALGAPMALLFTSGTTGVPKMAVLTWRNLMYSATGSAIKLGHLPEDRWLDVLPMCHIAGLSIVTRCALLGTTVVVHEEYRARRVADAMVDGSVTMVSLVSRQLEQVFEALGTREVSSALRVVLLGGGPVPPSLVRESRERGVPVHATYGMTEASSQVATMRSGDMEGVGGPLVWTQVALRGGEEEGEIWVRGPTVSPGYVVFEGEEPRWPEGEVWFGTGDWAGLGPGGGLRILDRRTDLIVTGGENVYPAEVERALEEHPDIQMASVVGIPDDTWGHRLVAALVARVPGVVPEDDAVYSWCRSRLAGFKVPRELRWWDSLPQTGLEKVSRREVRRRWQTQT